MLSQDGAGPAGFVLRRLRGAESDVVRGSVNLGLCVIMPYNELRGHSRKHWSFSHDGGTILPGATDRAAPAPGVDQPDAEEVRVGLLEVVRHLPVQGGDLKRVVGANVKMEHLKQIGLLQEAGSQGMGTGQRIIC